MSRAACWLLGMCAAALSCLPAAVGAGEPPAAPSVGSPSQATSPAGPATGLGSIVIDRASRSFRVPGKVIRREPPLEFLAVARGGTRAYESLLELDAGGKEFNLACILIGLEHKKSASAAYHFDPSAIDGDKVDIQVSWQQGDGKRSSSAAGILQLRDGEAVGDDWVYTGSGFTPSGEYLAELDGALIGFVHDPASVIEHRTGLGLGDWGAVGGAQGPCPPVGTSIWLTVRNAKVDSPHD